MRASFTAIGAARVAWVDILAVGLLATTLATAAGCAGAPRVSVPPAMGFQRGVSLGFVDVASVAGAESFRRAVAETRALGADCVSILVPLYTEGVHGSRVTRGRLDDSRGGDGTARAVERDGGASGNASDELATVGDQRDGDAQLDAAVTLARAGGHGVLIFPIVRLRVRLPGEWRGKLEPVDRAAWWQTYADTIVTLAARSQAAGATRFVIGSELVSFETDAAAWRALAARVRGVFSGRLLYSANWDRYLDISFWDAVDEVGISAYFTLAAKGADPTVGELVRAWRPITEALASFSRRVARPIVFTEVGFPSVHGAAYWP